MPSCRCPYACNLSILWYLQISLYCKVIRRQYHMACDDLNGSSWNMGASRGVITPIVAFTTTHHNFHPPILPFLAIVSCGRGASQNIRKYHPTALHIIRHLQNGDIVDSARRAFVHTLVIFGFGGQFRSPTQQLIKDNFIRDFSSF